MLYRTALSSRIFSPRWRPVPKGKQLEPHPVKLQPLFTLAVWTRYCSGVINKIQRNDKKGKQRIQRWWGSCPPVQHEKKGDFFLLFISIPRAAESEAQLPLGQSGCTDFKMTRTDDASGPVFGAHCSRLGSLGLLLSYLGGSKSLSPLQLIYQCQATEVRPNKRHAACRH